MTDILLLEGPPAQSVFRLAKIRQTLPFSTQCLYAEYVHILKLDRPLDDDELSRAEALLHYGPGTALPQLEGG